MVVFWHLKELNRRVGAFVFHHLNSVPISVISAFEYVHGTLHTMQPEKGRAQDQFLFVAGITIDEIATVLLGSSNWAQGKIARYLSEQAPTNIAIVPPVLCPPR
jgi:hypothetical protein